MTTAAVLRGVRPGHLLLVLTLAVFGAYLLFGLVRPMGLFSDPAHGFEVWRSMLHGAPFGHRLDPDLADISRDQPLLLTWWTPGQYVVPGLLSEALGLTLGRASLIVTFAAALLAVAGWYRLYREFGFSDLVASLSCAVLIGSTTVATMFGYYVGGTALLLAAAPWVFLLSIRIGMANLRACVVLVAAFLAGFFLKSAFLVVVLAACGGMALAEMNTAASFRRNAGIAMRALALFGITWLIAKFGWLDHGYVPSESGGGGMRQRMMDPISASLAGPLVAITAIADVLFELYRSGFARPRWRGVPIDMLVLAVMSVLFLLVALWHSPRRRYGAYTLAAFAAYAVVFAYFLSFNTAVGFRSTYFKVPGMMMLPGIIVAVQRLQIRAVHWAGVALLVLTCLPGPYIAARNFQWRAALDVGIESFSLSASAELLEALRRIDNGWPARTALVQVGEPTWSLEIRNQRVFVGKAWNSGVSSIQKRIKHGVPAAAYVALPARAVEDGRADAVLSTYVDVKDWVSVGAGDAVIYYPRGQAGPDLGGLQHPGAQGSLTRDQ